MITSWATFLFRAWKLEKLISCNFQHSISDKWDSRISKNDFLQRSITDLGRRLKGRQNTLQGVSNHSIGIFQEWVSPSTYLYVWYYLFTCHLSLHFVFICSFIYFLRKKHQSLKVFCHHHTHSNLQYQIQQ